MNTQVGYAGLKDLTSGQKVRYIAGRGEHHVNADAEVKEKPGATGCWVTIKRFHTKGTAIEYNEGDIIIAGADELFYID